MASICSDETLEVRFLAKVKKGDNEDSCWLWQASTQAFGYGCIGTSKGLSGAHRVSYRLYKGEIPDGICVLHKCDNPKCCNPKHLFLGTKRENAIDRNRKGRGKFPVLRGEASPAAKLTKEQVEQIRASSESHSSLSRLYGVVPAQIHRIRRGERWAD